MRQVVQCPELPQKQLLPSLCLLRSFQFPFVGAATAAFLDFKAESARSKPCSHNATTGTVVLVVVPSLAVTVVVVQPDIQVAAITAMSKFFMLNSPCILEMHSVLGGEIPSPVETVLVKDRHKLDK